MHRPFLIEDIRSGDLPEPAFNDLARLAALACDAPAALCALDSTPTPLLLGSSGLTPADIARVLPDRAAIRESKTGRNVPNEGPTDPTSHSSHITSTPGFQEIAYVPLVRREGDSVGTLSVFGPSPHALRPEQFEILALLARQCMGHLECRCRANRRSVGPPAVGEDATPNHAPTDATKEGPVPRRRENDCDVPAANQEGRDVVGRDTSEKHPAEESQQSFEARYRTLFERAPDGILIGDRNSRYLDANPSMCRMLGYTHDELVGLHAYDIIAAAESAQIAPVIRQIKDRTDHHQEWQFRRKDGSLFPVEVIATLTPEGNLLGMVRDITERKRSEARLRRLIESNIQGVLFWNRNGIVTEANDAFLRIVGYSREDLNAGLVRLDGLMPAKSGDPAVLIKGLADALPSSSGSAVPLETELLRRDGSRVPVLLGAASFEHDPGEGVCFVLDQTDRKRLEQQFLRAQRMESIGTLAGGIAHDLNNVLLPIMMSIELLRLDLDRDERLEILDAVKASAHRGADMVRQVLTFARGLEGRRLEVRLDGILKDVARIATDTFPKSIRIETEIPGDLWLLVGDPTQLHQVLLNLCVNARDAMPEGGTLRLRAENRVLGPDDPCLGLESRTGRHVLVQVADNGSGMAPDILEKIFDPFFTTKEVGKGTGLGLSTSLAIVKSHGGFLRVQSEPGQGSRFDVFLPAADGPAPEATAPHSELPRGNGELILVIDDESGVRQLARQTLEAFGYRVLLAENGAAAVPLYKAHAAEVAAVLTDMMMPVMDGPTTLQALRGLSPNVRIIATSGLNLDGRIPGTAGSEFARFLPKPYTAEALLRTLRDTLKDGL